jgi:hypothetical protein
MGRIVVEVAVGVSEIGRGDDHRALVAQEHSDAEPGQAPMAHELIDGVEDARLETLLDIGAVLVRGQEAIAIEPDRRILGVTFRTGFRLLVYSQILRIVFPVFAIRGEDRNPRQGAPAPAMARNVELPAINSS